MRESACKLFSSVSVGVRVEYSLVCVCARYRCKGVWVCVGARVLYHTCVLMTGDNIVIDR